MLRIFDDMKEFDPGRASYVIGLVKSNLLEAPATEKAILRQMRANNKLVDVCGGEFGCFVRAVTLFES